MDNLFILSLIALAGGAALGINRSLLGELGSGIGPAKASVINHLGGAIFLLLILFIKQERFVLSTFIEAPRYAYIGGVIGALFVALVSWLLPKVGAMKTTILLISGEMLVSTAIDYFSGKVTSIPLTVLGLGFVLLGVFVGEARRLRKTNAH